MDSNGAIVVRGVGVQRRRHRRRGSPGVAPDAAPPVNVLSTKMGGPCSGLGGDVHLLLAAAVGACTTGCRDAEATPDAAPPDGVLSANVYEGRDGGGSVAQPLPEAAPVSPPLLGGEPGGATHR